MPLSLRHFINEASWAPGADHDFRHTLSLDVLFLHRKAVDLYLLAAKLKVTPAGMNPALKEEEGMTLFLDGEFTFDRFQ